MMLYFFRQKNKRKEGFVMLFAVVLTSIIMAIALGLAEMSLRAVSFSSTGPQSNEAFFAADTGAECALYYDLRGTKSFFGVDPASIDSLVAVATPNCAGTALDLYQGTDIGPWIFYLPNLGASRKSCARVTVTKSTSSDTTSIVSEGYNIGEGTDCASTSTRRVERRLEVNY
ncbi:MAG: pilus assembly PilX N-terminal domain-containing protein, partial [Candidatus Paceibacterota bacterium]